MIKRIFNKKSVPIFIAIFIGIIIGVFFYFFGRNFSAKTENPFQVNPVVSVGLSVAICVGAVIYWRKG